MGPSRFERESEDPQSPRMARLPYGPALILFAGMTYLSCPVPASHGFLPFIAVIGMFVLLDPLHKVVEFRVRELDLVLDCVKFTEELFDPDVHDIHDKLLKKDCKPEDDEDVCFVCHNFTRWGDG